MHENSVVDVSTSHYLIGRLDDFKILICCAKSTENHLVNYTHYQNHVGICQIEQTVVNLKLRFSCISQNRRCTNTHRFDD